ncbi:MAG: hypothetical protein SWH54_03350 [Thermodesulfobacteriota bacterium]|nr:hypothetical protein [Thermodesulfobacteriota bacterium]
MKKHKKDNEIETIFLPQPSSSDLRGKQSVRATFKLTEKSIHAINVVSVHLGIKQKSLFDHLIEDKQCLKLIAGEIKEQVFSQLSRIQKTYVLSRRTLSSLDQTAKKFNAPRDALVEYSIQRLIPVIAGEKEKHRKRKFILTEMTKHLEHGEKILQKSAELLGQDDPVYRKFKSVITAGESAYKHIESFIEKGEIIEEF